MVSENSLQRLNTEENVQTCPECGGRVDSDGDERFCVKCGYVIE